VSKTSDRGDRPRWHEEHDLICAVIWHEDIKAALTIDPDIFRDWREEWVWVQDFVNRCRRLPKPRTIEKAFEEFQYEPCNEPIAHYIAAVRERHRFLDLAQAGYRAADLLMAQDSDGAAEEFQRVTAELVAAQFALSAESQSADTANTAATTWEAPAEFGAARGTPTTFPTDALPDWLAAYVAAEATATQTPPDLAGVLVLATLAAAAGRAGRGRGTPGLAGAGEPVCGGGHDPWQSQVSGVP
jgi:hypothetical protein